MLQDLQKQFQNPGCEYRGKPFWAWNGKLDPEELRRQIRLMKRMGLGGFFMHSRVGLDTEYLGKEWFECVRACIDEAKKQEMQAWAYDEDRWPSGAGGGKVTKNPAYRMRSLRLEVVETAKKFARNKDTIAVFTGRIDGNNLSNLKEVKAKETPAPAKGESILHFFVHLQDESDWYNGETYLDTMNSAAVAEFIKITHEAYKKEIGRDLGKTVPGIFTDEPNHGPYDSGDGKSADFPWTDSLPAEFKKRYGYDLLPHLPEIYYNVEGAGMRARYHYHDCTTALFVEAFSKQIGEWCGKNHMLSTGHVLEEDTLSAQTRIVGGCMRHYEYMQTPGIDLLTEHWRIFPTAKQTVSMAHQFGKKWRLSETYGCTGWDFPFLGHKALGDWQAALGINIRCQHLAWYSMKGEAKRDYPASIFYQSPWWEDYRKVEDYFARVYSIITLGEEVRSILVVHPVESSWLKVTVDNWRERDDTRELDRSFIALSDRLLADNLDYDYGDEEVMSRHAKVVKGAQGAELRVGRASYRAVVVPMMDTMRASTLALLKKFRAAGGKVIFTAAPASMIEGEVSGDVADFAGECETAALPELAAALADCRTVSIADENGKEIEPALYMLREDDDAFYLFVCNTGVNYTENQEIFHMPMARDRKLGFGNVVIRGCGALAACAGAPIECQTESGEFTAAAGKNGKNGWEITTSLPAVGSRLFIIPKEKTACKLAAAQPVMEPRKSQDLGSEFDVGLSEANVLALDWPEFSIEGGSKGSGEILHVDGQVRKALGLSYRGGGMKQPWLRGTVKNPKSVVAALDYRFDVAELPSGGLYLCLENPQCCQMFVNDQEIAADMEAGWWCDVSLRQFMVPAGALRLGENHLRIVCNYDENNSGLEIVYLRGNFTVSNVDKIPTIGAALNEIRLGDWTAQGLPFYSGNVIYRQSVKLNLAKKERASLLLGEWRGVAVKVRVNGEDAGAIAWAPFAADITPFVKNGAENLIEIEVLGHRRNSHGPLHMRNSWPDWTGPGEFQDNGNRGYNLVPCGLLSEPQIVIGE